MLFDLRGRGRRRTIQIIYVFLALLFLSGALIGVGSGYSLQDVFGGGSSGSGSLFQKQIDALDKRVKRNPRDAPAWAKLARAHSQSAFSSINQTTGQLSADGRQELHQAAIAWDRYVALDPPKPDVSVARQMAQTFRLLNAPANAAGAQELVTQVDHSRNAFLALALFAFEAGQTRKGDLAADQALKKTPKDEKPNVQAQIDTARQQAASKQLQQQTGAKVNTTPTPTPPTGAPPTGAPPTGAPPTGAPPPSG
jgi:hypothetical protein